MSRRYLITDIKLLSQKIDQQVNVCLQQDESQISRMQYRIINYINNSHKSIFQRDVEKRFLLRRSTVSDILYEMEQKGLIVREHVDYDARLKKLVLTDKALMQLNVMKLRVDELEYRLWECLNDDEIVVMQQLMDKINRNLSLPGDSSSKVG